MTTKIFITGATGYIGGDALYALHKVHPDWSYVALVRDSNKGAVVASQYANVRLVYGTLDDSAIIEEEASKADIVIHTADSSDHMGAAKAIAKGLAAGHSKEHLGFWLHISGTGILCWKDMETGTHGEAPLKDQEYDDLEGVERLTGLPDSAWHRDVDKVVLETGIKDGDKVKTAILCPPTIYGPGRGPGNQRSKQIPALVEETLKQKRALQIGAGKTEWNNVHVQDLSQVFVLLADAAVSKNLSPELWGERGYFLVENGVHVWSKIGKKAAEDAHKAGYIPTKPETLHLTHDEAKDIAGMQALTWGLNSKGTAHRASKFLGWKPKEKSLEDLMPDIVEVEAKRLGLSKGHAATVA